MRIHRIGLAAALLLAAQFAGTGCITMPEVKDRVVDLVATGTTTLTLHATGATNTIADAGAVNLGTELDLNSVLSDAGIDISNVKSISLSAVSYRVVTPDVTAGRTITNGNVNIAIGGASLQPLVQNFSGAADAVTPWITPTLGAAAVGQINALLDAWLAELQGGAPPNKNLSWTLSGTSAPITPATDFYYEVRLTISIVGSVKTQILS